VSVRLTGKSLKEASVGSSPARSSWRRWNAVLTPSKFSDDFDVLPKEVLGLDRVVCSDVSHYTYRVSWSAEDDEFVATCLEFPSLSWLAASQVEALEGLMALLRDTVVDMEEQGEDIRVPLSEAAEEHMSLDRYVVKKLTS
jgi:predicted RNase H-like HicB family nuclease